jgi:hypothetical protein
MSAPPHCALRPVAVDLGCIAASFLVALLVTPLFVLLQDGSSGHFLGSLAVPAAFLGAFLDVLILTLFFASDSADVFFRRHLSSHLMCGSAISMPAATISETGASLMMGKLQLLPFTSRILL